MARHGSSPNHVDDTLSTTKPKYTSEEKMFHSTFAINNVQTIIPVKSAHVQARIYNVLDHIIPLCDEQAIQAAVMLKASDFDLLMHSRNQNIICRLILIARSRKIKFISHFIL